MEQKNRKVRLVLNGFLETPTVPGRYTGSVFGRQRAPPRANGY